EPGDRDEDGHQHGRGGPGRQLNASNVEKSENGEHYAGPSPPGICAEAREIVDEIVHHQNAVQAVQKKRPDPVPPAALESPEIAEGSMRPAIKAALHRKNAVQFGRGKGYGNAPEKGHKGEEHERHAGPGLREDLFITEGTARCVAVEDGERRKKPDG